MKAICKMCGQLIKNKHPSYAKYCDECSKIRKNEIARKIKKRYRKINPEYCQSKNHLNKSVKVNCNRCGKLRLHWARGLCKSCYTWWKRWDNKLKSMSEQEKQEYLISRGFLEKELTIEDLKHDLGVI